ncbi:hypothetical protein ES703_09788 [subsurface metagenome]
MKGRILGFGVGQRAMILDLQKVFGSETVAGEWG